MSLRFEAFGTASAAGFESTGRRLDVPLSKHHIHALDMPFRLTSTWLDRGCQLGTWSADGRILAWALLQPPWNNLDYAIAPSMLGSSLESELFSWGVQQIGACSARTGAPASGSVEILEATHGIERTVEQLMAGGFEKLDWDTIRFALRPDETKGLLRNPRGYVIRPTSGGREESAYLGLVQAVFGSSWMTSEWRRRITAHPAYRRDLDFVATDPSGTLAGFCLCWLQGDVVQIEPIGVHPDHQGRGLGSALEQAAADGAHRVGARLLYIDHGGTNDGAMAMSRKVGFRPVHRILRYGTSVGPS